MADVRHRGFPLGMLFLLVAFCAVLASTLTVLIRAIREGAGGETAAISGVSTAGLLTIAGGVLGAHYARRLRGCCLGSSMGLLLGGLVGPLVVLDARHAWSILQVCLGGSVLLVSLAAAIRWASHVGEYSPNGLVAQWDDAPPPNVSPIPASPNPPQQSHDASQTTPGEFGE